jgi:A/G-specific adenine glycosylase
VIGAWGRLGYPRRARRLWEASVVIAEQGWPDDLEALPGVGRYTARAIEAQCDDVDVGAIEVNVRRVVERVTGRRLTTPEAEAAMLTIGAPLRGRDRLLALMDVGATLCRPQPRCAGCPLGRRCRTKGTLAGEAGRRAPSYEGSFRQRRGHVLAALRAADSCRATDLDAEALASLVTDGLAVITPSGRASLP